ncbi:hypothetical protein [Neobacillus sp. YIM B06451]|uniref:hypothetical protein n=1 Tax=Neobacillus sp. YIM B06451 TaxID=3070994 RepID=UPI00292DE467|nr:hypothetical protein [Neobacillus sp. YIM B06451]
MKDIKGMKKGLLAFLAAFMLTGIATGCSSDDTDAEDPDTEETETEEDSEE